MVNSKLIIENIRAAGWSFSTSAWNNLDEKSRDFLAYELSGKETPGYNGPTRTFDYYKTRLKMLGFEGVGTVLDAGCGIGQWTICLSTLNRNAIGVDQAQERIEIARTLAHENGHNNCEFLVSQLEKLPLSDNSVDAVICYGVLMFTNIPQTLSEFHRVLKSGGKVYININSLGWGIFLLWERGVLALNTRMIRDASRMIWNTIWGRQTYRFHTKRTLIKTLQNSGFQIIDVQHEGELHLNPYSSKVPPRYPGKLYGLPAILDCVAIKL